MDFEAVVYGGGGDTEGKHYRFPMEQTRYGYRHPAVIPTLQTYWGARPDRVTGHLHLNRIQAGVPIYIWEPASD